VFDKTGVVDFARALHDLGWELLSSGGTAKVIADVIYQLVGGLRSGMGYAGAATLPELHQRARFMRVTTAGREESHPHDVTITHEAPNYHSS
jgi:hypothetical protein